jgi:DNA polymerase III alpha subunit (gram-positive type)
MAGIPGKSYREIIQFAKKRGIKYILINKNTHQFNPDFEGSIRSADLKEIYGYQGKDGNWITVYEVIY